MKYKSHVVKRNIITFYISKNNKIHKNEFIQLLQILSIYLNSLCEWFLFSHSSPCCCNSNCLAMLWSIAVIVHTYTHSSVPPSLFGYNSCNFSLYTLYMFFSVEIGGNYKDTLCILNALACARFFIEEIFRQ